MQNVARNLGYINQNSLVFVSFVDVSKLDVSHTSIIGNCVSILYLLHRLIILIVSCTILSVQSVYQFIWRFLPSFIC